MEISSSLNIIYEDDVLLVCNKPAGLMVEPDRNNHPNLLNIVKQYLVEKTKLKTPYVQHLHRLDRPTSGIVLFTKDKNYLKNLSEQFAQRQVQKFYYAYTENAPEKLDDTLENWIRKEKKKALIVTENTPFSEKAILKYNCKTLDKIFIWDINLLTGKYHQIRTQLSNINCPIIGDELYGSKVRYKQNAIALQAYKLIIQHPISNKEIIFETEKERDFSNFLQL
jgi:RluA family pseudouridine synthase